MAGTTADQLEQALGELARAAAKVANDALTFQQVALIKKQRFEDAAVLLDRQVESYREVPVVPFGENQPGQDPIWGPLTDMEPDPRVSAWYNHSLAVRAAMNRAILHCAVLRVWTDVGVKTFGLGLRTVPELHTWVSGLSAEAKVQAKSLGHVIKEEAIGALIVADEMAQWIRPEVKTATNTHRQVAIYRQGVVDGLGRAPQELGKLEMHLRTVATAVATVHQRAQALVDELGEAIDE